MSATEVWRGQLRMALMAAMKARDTVSTAVLRGAIAAIDNAEAVAPVDAAVSAAGAIAGASAGVGSTDVARRVLSDEDVRSLLTVQVTEREDAAATYRAHGRPEEAGRLAREAAVLRTLLVS